MYKAWKWDVVRWDHKKQVFTAGPRYDKWQVRTASEYPSLAQILAYTGQVLLFYLEDEQWTRPV